MGPPTLTHEVAPGFCSQDFAPQPLVTARGCLEAGGHLAVNLLPVAGRRTQMLRELAGKWGGQLPAPWACRGGRCWGCRRWQNVCHRQLTAIHRLHAPSSQGSGAGHAPCRVLSTGVNQPAVSGREGVTFSAPSAATLPPQVLPSKTRVCPARSAILRPLGAGSFLPVPSEAVPQARSNFPSSRGGSSPRGERGRGPVPMSPWGSQQLCLS